MPPHSSPTQIDHCRRIPSHCLIHPAPNHNRFRSIPSRCPSLCPSLDRFRTLFHRLPSLCLFTPSRRPRTLSLQRLSRCPILNLFTPSRFRILFRQLPSRCRILNPFTPSRNHSLTLFRQPPSQCLILNRFIPSRSHCRILSRQRPSRSLILNLFTPVPDHHRRRLILTRHLRLNPNHFRTPFRRIPSLCPFRRPHLNRYPLTLAQSHYQSVLLTSPSNQGMFSTRRQDLRKAR